MASRKERVRRLLAQVESVRADASRRRAADEQKLLEWARATQARIRRLVTRIESEMPGPTREAALRELKVLRRSTSWPPEEPVPDPAPIKAQEQARAKRMFDAVLPDVRRAKRFFKGFAGADPPTRADIEAYLAEEPRLVALATALKFSWTSSEVAELCANAPSAWLIARFGERLDRSDSTVKNLVHRRPRGSK